MFIKNFKYDILTDNGFKNFDGIQAIKKPEYVHLHFSDGSDIKVSNDHRFFNINGEEIMAFLLTVGDVIKSANGQLSISEISYIKDEIDLYDPINVDGYKYYSNGVLSHNCEFLGSSSTVIDSNILKMLSNSIKEPLLYDLEDKLRIYEKPLNNVNYVLGVDVAKGTGRHYSTVQVLKIISTNPLKLEQVCVYQNNFIDVYKFSLIINKICYYYNNASIMCENNSDGAAVVVQLWWEYENENLINTGSKEADLGIRATKNTKPKAVLFMKKLIESGDLLLYDKNTVEELNDFVDKGGRYMANNFDDDLVSALYWSAYLFLMPNVIDDVNFMDSEENEWGDTGGILSDVTTETDDDFYVVL